MTAKPFRHQRPAFRRISDYSRPSDAEHSAELADIIATFRSRLWQLSDGPDREEVRETLRRLAKMTSKEAAAHWRQLDVSVRMELDRAHWNALRDQYAPPRQYVRGIAYHRRGPADLPALAGAAFATMNKVRAGARQTTWLADQFAATLAAHWYREMGTRPTIHDEDSSPFSQWALPLFSAVGFALGDARRRLLAGQRMAAQQGDIPARA